ncbi:MAG: hypothetical protein O3C40_13680 [Planctomycetota bacterium]|nr:hypothetical protein [Planctomycetota bacterium]
MTTLERKLFERAVTALVCALAHDEAAQDDAAQDDAAQDDAAQDDADAETLTELRGHWIDDAHKVVDKAERLGIWGDFDE